MDLPSGTVTFLFSDIEGSTRHAHRLGDERWSALLREHDALVDGVIERRGGVVVKHEGDGTFAAFPEVRPAIDAAVEIERGLADGTLGDLGAGIRVRIGLHTGDGRVTDSGLDYVGIDVHYAARVAAAGNGGQIVVSAATRAALGGASGPPLDGGAVIVDEGPRKLKDFDDPRPLFRVVVPGVSDDDRPLRTEDLPGDLPALTTRFVGREAEIDRLSALMATTRLLTLTGPGGTGKTRLAIGLATGIRPRFGGGTWFVDLAPVRDPELVIGIIATTLRLREEPGVPVATTLREHLRRVDALMVLDNLEQLLPAAATIVATLLRESPGLRVIVTSREILRVAGEQEYAVPPLVGDEGVELFLDRARARRAGADLDDRELPVVRDIVARVEGLPLAIELAAARTRLMTPTAILERLGSSLDLLEGGARDLPERQRTLRGAVAWSHDLLADDERVIFRRLAVFNGGWTADAAEAVVDPDRGLAIGVVDGLESLADKSLVRVAPTEHGEPRFDRHVLIREYALERLTDAGERDGCERRHALTYLAVAELAGGHLLGDEAEPWRDVLDHEDHNLRAAMRWSLDHDEPSIGMRIATAVWRHWENRTRLSEGLAWTAELLDHPAAADVATRIGALSADGGMAYWGNDFERCRRRYTERLRLAEELADEALLAEAHYEYGFLGMLDQDIGLIRDHETIALEMFERLDDAGGAVRARQALVLVHFLAGEYAEARALEVHNLAAFRRMRIAYRVADSLMLLAVASIFGDELEDGRRYLRDSLRLTSGIMSDQIAGLAVTAHLALRSAQPEIGARLAGAAEAASAATGLTNAALMVLHVPDPADVARERLGDAAEPLLAEGRAMPMEDALAIAVGLTEPAAT